MLIGKLFTKYRIRVTDRELVEAADTFAKQAALSDGPGISIPADPRKIAENLANIANQNLKEEWNKFLKSKNCGRTIRTFYPGFNRIRPLSVALLNGRVKMDLLQFLHGHNRLNRYLSLIQKVPSPI
mgnify:CR=1 FL=1